MKIFSAEQIKKWDAFTIREGNITSEVLMKRAAKECFEWIITHYPQKKYIICSGKGNNGGDGLAIAEMMMQSKMHIEVYTLESKKSNSPDFLFYLDRLKKSKCNIHNITGPGEFPNIEEDNIVIDALFGTGLSGPLEGIAAALVNHINGSAAGVISIDIPSGMLCDKSSKGTQMIKAGNTLSFTHKLAFLMAENEAFIGRLSFMDIGLSTHYENTEPCPLAIPEQAYYRTTLKPRPAFGHKGNFGNAALVVGSHGMMGAAILAAKSYLRSGAGKLTCYVPECGYQIMQTSVPEAMCETSGNRTLIPFVFKTKYDAIGAGPGVGTSTAIKEVIHLLFNTPCPVVLDADVLNIIASDKDLLLKIPANIIITPHPGEFDRLFGKKKDDFQRLELAIENAQKLKIFIVLKGHHTAICTPDGKVFFNDSGNSGMAKPGMGDVLTGILTGFLAQGYSLPDAALLAVHLHGLAGDIAADEHSPEAMTAQDLIDSMDTAWKKFNC